MAIALAMIFHAQSGAHIELKGKILKVRTAPIDENSSVAAVDFRVTDPADYPFMAKSVTLIVVDASRQADRRHALFPSPTPNGSSTRFRCWVRNTT